MMKREAKIVTAPKANTPAVCVIVVVNPRYSACNAVPLDPTKYAPTIVLP